MIAPAVALSGEVDPLGMAEFIAHKGQIAFAAQAHGQQAEHLVKGHAPVHHHIFVVYAHAPVHFLVAEPEHNGLVAHQCLVVGLAVADHRLPGTADCQLIIDAVQIPVFIGSFLE